MDDEARMEAGPLSAAIFRVARVHKALAGRLLRECGLHPGQELVMMTLWEEGPQRQVDLAETLDADAPTMTRSIARLERAGLVRRTRSTTDRRAVIVEATEKSQTLKKLVGHAWAELERATVGAMSQTRISESRAILAELEASLTMVYSEDGQGAALSRRRRAGEPSGL
ncbi:MarR family winged helix-turn-helix transcriptional regulator [Microtetraspora malaysiensis]|uniref:MarR family winged helix-turn-helix transcriptional regulator n=1 Tax=Microtetraspora malaysiensis TaxID=161358 RepID=UPI003D89FAAA